jgi:hypothetical protein
MSAFTRIAVGLGGLILSTIYLGLCVVSAGAAATVAPVILLVPLALLAALCVDRSKQGR